MKKSRKFSLSLGRTFDRAANPVYIVDPDREIAYMNVACLDWLGIDTEVAQDARCYYTSETTERPKDDAVSGLCPPPELLAEPAAAATFTTSMTETHDTHIFRRSSDTTSALPATMTRLFDKANALLGVLVVAQPAQANATTPDQASPTNVTDSQTLHAALAAIRAHHQQYYSVGNLIGNSPFATRLRRQTFAVANLDAEILITGPTGSGREHLARTIATTKSQQDDLLLEVLHCVLADEELIAEIIDRVTDAARLNETSRVAIAATQKSAPLLLLLDIDKLPTVSMGRVSDFLQRHGSACRILATSEQSLIELAASNAFPTALAHQLSTLEINLIPLTQRRQDIPLMAQAFVEQINRTREPQLSGFDHAVLSLLTEYHWPGNAEQLQIVVAEACERATGPSIQASDLPDSFRHAIKALRIGAREETTIDLQQWLDDLEQELIQRAMGQAGGNKTKAAKLLTMTRSKLIRRVEHFQLPQDVAQEEPSDLIDSSAFEEFE